MTDEPTPQRLSQEDRYRIAQAHMAEHDGVFRPEEFVIEARSPNHPAHGWFTWDDSAAAHRYRLQQARQFVRIHIETPACQEIDVSSGETTISLTQPAMVSPISMRGRNSGGGYIDTRSPEGAAALAEEAGHMLRQWFFRFGGVLDSQQDKRARSLLRLFPEPGD